jgi:hypothetical protein
MTRIRTTVVEWHCANVELRSGSAWPATFEVYRNPVLHKLFQIMYLISKTRGYKHIVKLLPHEVAELEPALQLLLAQDRTDFETWEVRYVLFLWLSILVLVPFDLGTADSLVGEASSRRASACGGGGGVALLCSPLLTALLAAPQATAPRAFSRA